MSTLEDFIFEQANSVIANISPNELKNIYAYSFYVSNIEDDPRLPSLTIGYNTRANLSENIKEASSKDEAKWNYAFWLQNELLIIGEDEASKDLITEWIKKQKLYYTEEEEEEDFDTCFEKGEKITKSFINTLITTVQRFHKEHITELPILIHELEYFDEIKDQNILANGIERVKEFAVWIDNEME